jgi:hypothetical protein
MWRPLLRNNLFVKKRLVLLENSFDIEAIFFFMKTFLLLLTFAVSVSVFSADDRTEMTTEQKQKWMQDIDVESVSLIFAAADLGNAPSSFGHVFLKLNSNKNKTRTGLLDYGVNFAARTGDITGALYAWYGLLGYFQGTYNLVPFHQMIKDYTHLEGRDIWEFRLKMTPQQVKFLVQYLLEVDGQYYDYYFFNQNCASFILKLLQEVFAPVHLIKANEFFVLPMEVVDRLYRLQLLEDPIVRPSLETQWRKMKLQLSLEEAQHLVNAPFSQSLNLTEMSLRELQAGQLYWTLKALSEPKQYRPIAFASSKEIATRSLSTNEEIQMLPPQLTRLEENPFPIQRFGYRFLFGIDPDKDFHLGFRPLLFDDLDNMPLTAPFSAMEILNLKLSYRMDYRKDHLDSSQNSNQLLSLQEPASRLQITGQWLSIFSSKSVDAFDQPLTWDLQVLQEDIAALGGALGYGKDIIANRLRGHVLIRGQSNWGVGPETLWIYQQPGAGAIHFQAAKNWTPLLFRNSSEWWIRSGFSLELTNNWSVRWQSQYRLSANNSLELLYYVRF